MTEWRNINGFINYQVSDEGQIRSIDHFVVDSAGHSYWHNGRILKPRDVGKGYLQVSLCQDGVSYKKYIHQMVAEAFIHHGSECNVVNHKDGNKHNNNVSNLEWVTYSENNQHAYDTKLKLRGSGFYNARLTEEAVLAIRREYPAVQKLAPFAKRYGVSRATIRDVVMKKTWKTVQEGSTTILKDGAEFPNRSRGWMQCQPGENPLNRSALPL